VKESAPGGTAIDAEPLEVAKQWIAQTRWSAAETILREVALQSSPEDRASAHLLLGNIAFERGRFDEAVKQYRAAGAGHDAGDPDVRGTAATAQANIALALPAIERRERLAAARRRVLIGVTAALGAGLTALFVLVRRSGR
jgi:predicted negative regulator of RcsB-dependent stress response